MGEGGARRRPLCALKELLALLPPDAEPHTADTGHLMLSLHLRVRDGVCEQLLARGTALPARAVRLFTTSQDDQAAARLEFYVGERPFCEGNRFVGMMELAPLPMPSYRSFLQIEVDVEVDAKGGILGRAAEVESRALGEPYCAAEWRGELMLGAVPPVPNPFSEVGLLPRGPRVVEPMEVTLFSAALTKHLPVLLPTRTVRLAGKDVVIRQHQRREEQRIGTGGVLWEAAIVLADYVGRSGDWQGKRVLELGAGTGLVAIALAMQGAEVCATDGNPRVLEGARSNVEDAMRRHGHGPVALEVFDWNSPEDLAKILALGPWDVVLGSDLVYPGNAGKKCVDSNALSPSADETLISLLDALCGRDTVVILALKDRTGELERFSHTISRHKWSMERAPPERIMPEFRSVPQVAVLHLENGAPEAPGRRGSDARGENVDLKWPRKACARGVWALD